MTEPVAWKEFLEKKWQIPIDSEQEKKFLRYAFLLQQFSQKFNLTRLVRPEEIYFYHFVDSLAGYAYIRERKIAESTVLDIGSGAGFPGIPLKIVWPQAQVILVEANRHKKEFLETVIKDLKLSGIVVKNMRAEELLPGEFSPAVATLRAVGKILFVLQRLQKLDFVKCFLWYATEKLYRENELALRKNGFQLIPGEFYFWAGLTQQRIIVGIKR